MCMYLYFTGGTFRVSLDNQNLKTGDPNAIFSYRGEKDWADKVAGLLPTNYIQPSVAQPPNLIPVGQTPGNDQSGDEVERIINGEAREWESNLLEPIRFPLISSYPKVGPEQQRPTLNQPQSVPLPTFLVKKPAAPSSLVESSFENKKLVAKPAVYVAASSPSFQSQPASPVVNKSPFGSLNQMLYTVSSPGGKPVFERPQEHFEEPLSSGSNMMGFSGTQPKYDPILEQESHEYPSVDVKPQNSPPFRNAERSSQGNGIDGSTGYALPLWKPSFLGPVGGLSYRDWMGFPFAGFGNDLYYGQMAFKPQNFMTNTPNYWVPQLHIPQRVIRPSSRRPRRKSYARSKSGYQRRRFLQSKTTYIPGFGMPQRYTPKSETQRKYPKSLTPFRKPAQNQRLLVREPITSWKL